MKLMKFSKRAFALVLAATMAFSNSFVVSAATPTKATDLSGAYDGTPSKVIGVEVNAEYNSFTDANGLTAATYVWNNYEALDDTPLLPGKSDDYKDVTTGLYVYNGVYYTSYSIRYQNGVQKVRFYNSAIFGDPVEDPATELYTLNGKYYAYYNTAADGRKYVGTLNEVVYAGTYADDDAFNLAHGVKYDPSDSYYDYYNIGGRAFPYRSYNYLSSGSRAYFAYLTNEIIMNGANPDVSWNYVTTDDKYLTADNKVIEVGYQVEVNGSIGEASITTAEGDSLYTYRGVELYDIVVRAGQSLPIRVRAVYYTATETVDANGKTSTVYNTYKKGSWSEPYTFKYNGPVVKEYPALSVTAVQDDDRIKIDWNANANARNYRVEYIRSNVPLTLTADNWDDYHAYSSNALDALEAANPGLSISYGQMSTSSTQYYYSWNKDTVYHYFMVYPTSFTVKADINRYAYSNIAGVQVVPKGVNTPAISNFKAIKKAGNSGITLSWTPLDANVVIYGYEKKSFPAYYNYNILDASAKVVNADGSTTTKWLSDEMDAVTKKIVDQDVLQYTYDGEDGEATVYPEPGKTYYFIAHTYDDVDYDVAKATPVATIDNIPYNYYTSMGPATKTVSGKATIAVPSVVTSAGKTSIKISVTNYDYDTTGFEIYRKSGKKWKKVANTIDNHYIDEKLKANTKYSYKIRAYYYNTDSKVKAYSDYKFFTATTGTADGIMLTATKKSSKSVKLTWTKVTGVTKYEIYRSNEYSGDPSKLYEKFSSGNYKSYLNSQKYELIKTAGKSSTSYTNSGLAAGEDYAYVIMAYYKSGKKTAYVSDAAWVSMEVGTPQDVASVNTGSKVKVTWTKDPYAKKYEVQYKKYDTEGYSVSSDYVTKTTSKNSFTVSGIENGGFAEVRVRAIGKNGRYSSWSSITQGKSLAGAKSVKATNVIKTLPSGKKVAAVKISWKKVSGAKYYRVFRTTKKPTYYADSKMYAAYGSDIAKESNDDEDKNGNGIDEIEYEDLYGVYGSITKTSAIDYAQLDTGVDYYYTVVAYGAYNTEIASYASYDNNSAVYGSGSYSKITFNNKVTITAKVAKKKVTLSWNKIPGVTKYVVYRATSKKGKYTKIGTTKKASYTDKKVKKGKTYYYKIEAVGKNILKNEFEITSNILKVKAK